MDYVKECLECGEPVDFVTYLKHQDIEKRHIFNRHFQNTLEKMTSSSNNTGADEQLREWAQEIIDNNFEVNIYCKISFIRMLTSHCIRSLIVHKLLNIGVKLKRKSSRPIQNITSSYNLMPRLNLKVKLLVICLIMMMKGKIAN
jgi:hypothetical protein